MCAYIALSCETTQKVEEVKTVADKKVDEVKEEVQIEEKQIVKQPVSVADDDETDF